PRTPRTAGPAAPTTFRLLLSIGGTVYWVRPSSSGQWPVATGQWPGKRREEKPPSRLPGHWPLGHGHRLRGAARQPIPAPPPPRAPGPRRSRASAAARPGQADATTQEPLWGRRPARLGRRGMEAAEVSHGGPPRPTVARKAHDARPRAAGALRPRRDWSSGRG